MEDSVGTTSPRGREEEEEAAILSKYLHPGYSADPQVLTFGDQGDGAVPPPESETGQSEQQDSLKLLGGDIHRDLYKVNAKPNLSHPRRANTIDYLSTRQENATASNSTGVGLSAAEQRAPGGFRRQYLLQQNQHPSAAAAPMTRSFIDFLDLYGSFAGEDLAASDDESGLNDDGEPQPHETRPLLGGRKPPRRQIEAGTASKLKSFFTLLKAFVGTGIMFLPKAFNNGGILFSSITLVTVAALTCICFRLLLHCRKKYGGGGYGELGEIIVGSTMRTLILSSITISQIGFVCASLIFTAENLKTFIKDVIGNGSKPLSTNMLIMLQLLILIPLALIRKISKLGPAALLADVFILLGLTYIWQYDITTLATEGVHESVELFNPRYFTLTIGSAIFTFEGIGLILPIQSSMKEPEKFDSLLYAVMLIITIIFTSVGALSYATFGSFTKTEIISNFPPYSKIKNAVQFLYSLAILVGTPVQLFPAVRILEGKFFGHLSSGARSRSSKWKKNAFRAGIVILSGLISAVGASDLDKFVALIGSFACVPLVYIYPAFLHYKGVATSKKEALGDILMIIIGAIAAVFSTAVTLVRWIQE